MIDKILKKSEASLEKLLKKHKIDHLYPISALAVVEEPKLAMGELEIMPDGYGFLRNSNLGQDVYISASQIKRLNLKNTDFILSEVREPIATEKNFAILKVLLVNDNTLEKAKDRVHFDDLVPRYPDKKLMLGNSLACRVIDLISPIGKGQRALIVAPPKAGKTMLMTELANGISQNNENVEVWMLLVDERPEEVTDIKENVKCARVFSSTFDENPQNHIKVTEKVLELAKRAVEYGKDIVILVDNITRMARAYNLVVPSSGKLISGGLDPYAFVMPKKFFGAARSTKASGSLTILATALYDTGSRMDDVVYEEFKGTGNCEIHLDRSIAEMKIFPAINIKKSGTRREELFFSNDELTALQNMRRYLLSNFNEIEATKKLIDFVKTEKYNEHLLVKFQKS